MLRELESRADLVRNFAPSWFASVMGTGILALTTLSQSKYIPFLKQLADVLFYFNVVLFFMLLVPWVLRCTHFRQQALADLMHPVISSFYATFAIGMLVLSADFIIIGKNMLIGSIFWFAGTIFTIFFGVFIPYIMFKGNHSKNRSYKSRLVYTAGWADSNSYCRKPVNFTIFRDNERIDNIY